MKLKLYKKAILLLSGCIILSNQPTYAKEKVTITISFAGDCTLGNDKNAKYENRFNNFYQNNNNDSSYYFKNVKDIFLNDDYTLINLETTLTTKKNYQEKQFNFKGLPEYTKILIDGGIDGVNIANNHTHDYLEQGYIETINNLEKANIDYSGDDYILIKNIKGVDIAFIGLKNNINFEKIDAMFKKLESFQYDFLVASSHYGIEGEYQFNEDQQKYYHYLIDKGADIVVGHHPHVIQGIEEYKNKHIIYSLGNFCYGGHSNPKDKDTMIVQEIITFEDGELINNDLNIIPCSLSSTSSYNNFQPTILEGKEKERVLEKIKKYSN